MAMEDFLKAVADHEVPYMICAHVNIKVIALKGGDSLQACADKVAWAVGEVQMLHWSQEKTVTRKCTRDKAISYSCVQSEDWEHKPKVPKGVKSHDSRQMEQFACSGWLHINASADSNLMRISVKHVVGRQPFLEIKLLEKWKDYIQQHSHTQTPEQIWQHITRVEGTKSTAQQIKLPF
ncbi:hypothetical protein BC628DRAFT_1338965 [Trametes gibbosa]|nr:hypothetical protein BC628DRAFT_1338965 [Trametes gibbosa]